ncbi:MAG TPA: hypothetical protein DDZ80_10125 [Cyanobacteria bacterium UBA8803]|nr:hypothetical protein [Cyanobacteria bacterium UBA9273]HBL58848.1 hypothetical protein [Cyanobacteria bacterium UBA8803]
MPKVLDPNESYTFSKYFDLPFSPEDILADLGCTIGQHIMWWNIYHCIQYRRMWSLSRGRLLGFCREKQRRCRLELKLAIAVNVGKNEVLIAIKLKEVISYLARI